MNETVETKPKKPKGRYTSVEQILKRIDKVLDLKKRLDAEYLQIAYRKAKGISAGDKGEIHQCNYLERLNNQNTSKANSKLRKLREKLAIMRTPVLLAADGEDGSIPRK